jgi:hypothetical protein
MRIASSQRRLMAPEGRIRVDLDVVDQPVMGSEQRSGRLSFDLSLEEAVAAGRALAKPSR